MKDSVRFNCAVDGVMSVIGGKWKTTILCLLSQKERLRFSQLKRSIPPISPRVLSKQLKELAEDGIIMRVEVKDSSYHVEYSLTEKGKSLRPVLECMADWGLKNLMNPVIEIDEEP